jgi:hypothetical protein
MIVYKRWNKTTNFGYDRYYYEGWYLFGFIPLYIKVVKI